MTADLYALARRLVAGHGNPGTWVYVRLVKRMRRVIEPLATCRDRACEAAYDVADGFAPDLTHPSCVGPLLQLACELGCRPLPVLRQLPDGRWQVHRSAAWHLLYHGATPGEALARFILTEAKK